MKSNKIIIYDDSCPLCSAYTKVFVSAGMIKKENRKSFTTIDPSIINLLDERRCSNEIPVIDNDTHEVWYGIDAITEIIQTKIPFAKKTVRFKPLRWLLHKVYKLISYNRRVIVATKKEPGNFDCTPDFNFRYRITFMFLFLLFNTAMLFPIQTHIINKSAFSINALQLQQAHWTLVFINIGIACSINNKKAIEYLGQVNMLAFTIVLMILPLLLFNKYHLIESKFFNNTYLLLLTLFVFKEYRRRMNYAGIIKQYPLIVVMNILTLLGFIFYLIC